MSRRRRIPHAKQNRYSSGNLDGDARDRITWTNNTSPKTDGYGYHPVVCGGYDKSEEVSEDKDE